MTQAVQFDPDDPQGLARAMSALGMQSSILVGGFQYWDSRRKGRQFPARGDLDPLIDIPRLVPHIILIDVRHDPLDFRFRLIGSAVRRNLARDYVGHWFSEFPNYSASSNIWPRHCAVAESGRPMLQRPTYVGPNKDFIYVENILLPLSVDNPGWSMQMMFLEFISKRH
ncbi:PAS domain-containing protein [Dongia mobilis]|nr:PAS domain-containing protein [Dongia mobilis]